MFAGKKSAQIREILISESAWEEMTCLFAPSKEKDMYTGLCFLPPQEITTTHIANHLYQDNNFLPEPEL